jgi:phenylalanyl-tRNA synthetase beta chain
MFYEIGRVYFPQRDEALPKEGRRLGIALTGPIEKPWWKTHESEMCGFFHLKGVVETLFDRIGITSHGYEPTQERFFFPGKCAVVRSDGVDLGFLGELHPDVLRSFELPDQPVVAGEFNLDALFEKMKKHRYQAISPFPAAKEDLAVVLEEEIPVHEIVRLAVEAGSPLVREVTVFDLWKGEKIPAGEKSVAFSLTYQADDRVLGADEMRETRERIIRRLAETLGARLRE